MFMLFKVIGVIGLILITSGMILRSRKERDILYLFGGIALAIYSIYLQDWIFIALQVVFTAVAIYDLGKTIRNKQR